MSKTGKVLAIDDNKDILFALKLLLQPIVEKIETIDDPARIPEVINRETWDVILLDMNFSRDAISGQEGFNWLSRILSMLVSNIACLFT